MKHQSYRTSRYSCRLQRGTTLVELLVGMTLSSLLVASILVATIMNKKLVRLDAIRTALNQHLRTGLSILSNDIKLAGEGLPQDFPAIQVFPSGSPFRLMLRRRVFPWTFSLCEDIASGASPTSLTIGSTDPSDAGSSCDYSGITASFQELGAFRRSWTGPQLRVFVYDPTSRQGDFAVLTGEQDQSSRRILTISPSGGFSRTYVRRLARVFILEEWSYRVNQSGHLEVVINGDTARPVTLIQNVSAFEPQAVVGTNALNRYEAAQSGYDWTNINAVAVTLRATSAPSAGGRRQVNPFSQRVIERSVRGEYFPRNSLSARS